METEAPEGVRASLIELFMNSPDADLALERSGRTRQPDGEWSVKDIDWLVDEAMTDEGWVRLQRLITSPPSS